MNKILKLDIIGFVFVSILGTLMHFMFEWFGNATIVGLFTPVNESPWEHLKMLFFPYLIFAIYTKIKLSQDKFNVMFAKYIGVIVGMIAILAFFYLYKGAIGKDIMFMDILSFFVGITSAFVVDYFIIKSGIGKGLGEGIATAMFILTSIVFFIFTFEPPLIPLFRDSKTMTYGI